MKQFGPLNLRPASLCVFVILSALVCAPNARADEPLLIIPTLHSQQNKDWVVPSSQNIYEEFSSLGVSAWNPNQIATEYGPKMSPHSGSISNQELATWTTSSRAALNYLSTRSYRNAIDELNSALVLAESKIDAFNADEKRASEVLDTCLYLARAYLETGDEPAAVRQISECRRLVPAVAPNMYQHPPEMQQLFRKNDYTLDDKRGGRVRVSIGEKHCPVRFNGIVLGTTPFSTRSLVPGIYRIEGACVAEQDRVYTIARIEQGSQDIDLEELSKVSVKTSPVLHLVYRSAKDENYDRYKDAVALANFVQTRALILISVPESNVMRIDWQPLMANGTHASVWLPLTDNVPAPESLREALQALLKKKSLNFVDEPPRAQRAWAPPARESEGRAHRISHRWLARNQKEKRTWASALALMPSGAALMAVSYGMYARRNNKGDDFIADPGNLGKQQDWLSARIPEYTTVAVGAAALSSGLILALPKQEKIPWWSFVPGGVGAGLLAYGFVEAFAGTSTSGVQCTSLSGVRTCVKRGKEIDRAILLSVTSIPFFTVPLTYVFRNVREKHHKAELPVKVTATFGGLGLSGEF